MGTKYTLYHSHYSLPSIIARFLVVMRGPCDGEDYKFEDAAIDIFAGAQLSAIVREGGDVMSEIPALRQEPSGQVVSGPVNIAEHLNHAYPRLLPTQSRSQLLLWMRQLQALDWFSLSLPAPEVSKRRDKWSLDSFRLKIKQRLELDTSAWYHASLLYRLRIIEEDGDDAQQIYRTRGQARKLLEDLDTYLLGRESEHTNWWTKVLETPNALEAHVVPSLARLVDAGNSELIPMRLRRYLDAAKRTRYWKTVMAERPTLR